MKILHIGKYFPPYTGGMEHYLRDLMAAQARQGIEPAALVHQSDISFSSVDESFPAGEQQLPVTRAAVWARLLFTPISPTFPWLLRRLIKQQQPDILHLHMPNVSVFWHFSCPAPAEYPGLSNGTLTSWHPGTALGCGCFMPYIVPLSGRYSNVAVRLSLPPLPIWNPAFPFGIFVPNVR